MAKGSLVGPLAELPKEDDLLYKIKELINEAVSDAFDQYQFDNPSEIYELVEQYFKQVPNATSQISPVITPIIAGLLGKKCKIFEVQSSATGYGMYNCREEIIDKTYLADETGAVKTRQLSTDAYLVMNLKESDPVAGSYSALALYDLMLGWTKIDDEGYLRWVGIPVMNDVRWVRAKEVTPATQNITCNIMHRDGGEAGAGELGYNIEVYADLTVGINLDDVIPQLQIDQWYPAHCVQGKWWFLQKFNQTGTLRLAKITSLAAAYYGCRLLDKVGKEGTLLDAINVYPEEHLGSNALNGSDVWPLRAVNDFVSVYYDIDGVWRTPGTVDDTVTCEGGQISISASADDTDVSNGISSILVDTTGGNVVLGGLVGGIAGQEVTIVYVGDFTNTLTIEHLEGIGGSQDFSTHTQADEVITAGGIPFICDGATWFDCGYARHV